MVRGSWRSWRRTRAAVAVVREAFRAGSGLWGGRRGGGGVVVVMGFVRLHFRGVADCVASSTRCRKASSTVSDAGAGAQGVGGVVGEELAVAHEEQAVAAFGLVHDVGGDEERRAAGGGDGVEEVPQVAAQDGVEADGGFVEHQEFRGAEEGDGQGDAAALAAGEVAGEGVGVGGEVDVGDGAGDVLVAAVGCRAAGVEDRGEVVQVLAGRQVVVDGGGLRDVADAGAQGGGGRRGGRGRRGCR